MSGQNSLADVFPVPGNECWYTVLTNSRHITSAGTIHSQALKGNRIAVAVTGKSWSHEMSGRLVCLSGDLAAIAADAHRRVRNAQTSYATTNNGKVASNIVFAGIACARASDIRTTLQSGIIVDVIYSPLIEDAAHSDITITGSVTEGNIEAVRDWLLRRLNAIRPENLRFLLTACGVPLAATEIPAPSITAS